MVYGWIQRSMIVGYLGSWLMVHGLDAEENGQW